MKAQECQHDYCEINDGAGRLMQARSEARRTPNGLLVYAKNESNWAATNGVASSGALGRWHEIAAHWRYESSRPLLRRTPPPAPSGGASSISSSRASAKTRVR
jgi:hypothetical protein